MCTAEGGTARRVLCSCAAIFLKSSRFSSLLYADFCSSHAPSLPLDANGVRAAVEERKVRCGVETLWDCHDSDRLWFTRT